MALQRLEEIAMSRGALAQAGDVFLLERTKLEQVVNGTSSVVSVEERRSQWNRQRRLRPPDVVGPRATRFRRMFQSADALGQRESNAGAFARGLGANPGRATGVIRVLASPDDSRLLGAARFS